MYNKKVGLTMQDIFNIWFISHWIISFLLLKFTKLGQSNFLDSHTKALICIISPAWPLGAPMYILYWLFKMGEHD